MQEINLQELVERLAKVERSSADQRKKLHRLIGEKVLKRLQTVMGTGATASWQESHVGSLGGYAAVRPDTEKEWTKGACGKLSKGYPHGYITNAIENGHKVRPPGPPSMRQRPNYRSQATAERVEGRGYYAAVRHQADRIAQEEIRKFVEELAKELEK